MYKLLFSNEGKACLASLDKKTAQRVLNKLKWLLQNIDSISHLSLTGNFSGLFKLRIGDWRVIYEINHQNQIVTVYNIGHRREIYK
ncbi:plasmid stabilization system protein [bacterium BMS3Bbin09]|nr:plasmid stabilization system protein [bacterium BMS3Bbin09]